MQYAALSDEAIVTIVRSKDVELFRILMERYQDKLIRYVEFLIKDREKAQDAVQETFIAAFTNLRGFDTARSFSSWIYRIAHNKAMNAVSLNAKETAFAEGFDPKSDENIEQELLTKADVLRAQHCIQELGLLYREPLVLFFIDEHSYEEISDILRIPMGTVAVRINRAKKMMRKLCTRTP